jgi:hypothetical protein
MRFFGAVGSAWGSLAIPVMVAVLSGCTNVPYSNPPAQIRVQTMEPSTVTVTFKGTDPATFTQPTATLTSEPGSIGANFKVAKVSYRRAGAAINGLADGNFSVAGRVEASPLATVPVGGQPGNTTNTTVTPGKGTFVLPVITGELLTQAKAQQLGSCVVVITLEGEDDSRFPVSVATQITVVFVGT